LESSSLRQQHSNVVCPGCACLCDDIQLPTDSTGILDFEPPCELGRRWFESNWSQPSSVATVGGKDCDFDEAIAAAAELLRECDYPLIYGLSRSATPGQRAAVALGEFLGGAVDTTASLCHGPSIMAIQEMGEVTCTLGEVKNRADLVIFWGCNPASSHPRHSERYSVTATGKFIPGGRDDRKVVMIGDASNLNEWKIDDAGTEPDLKIPVPTGTDYEVLSQLTHALRLGDDSILDDLPPEWKELAALVRASQYGIIFFGLGLAETGAWGGTRRSGTGHVNVAALLHLVAELNAVTRFSARRMRLQGDVSGADNVLCWQSTYPFSVDYSRGYPRYNPGEYTANELLERGDTDCLILVGAETVPYFTDRAKENLRKTPTILLDYPNNAHELAPAVSFSTAVYGIHARATAYRMDNVPLTLRQLTSSKLPTDEQVLSDLLKQLQ
ncbi:MAG: formylmethanofuran dehydrogenase subunit B, partial [Planctomycetota bacterium]